MTRYGMIAGLAALLILAVGPARAAAQQEPRETQLDPSEFARRLQEINKQLKDLRGDLDTLRRDVRDTSLSASTATATLRELRERLDLLQQMVLKHDDLMRSTANAERRYSFPAQPLRSAGTIRLENRSATGATVVLNGTPYYVRPYETRTLENLPAGPFTYEVMADGYGRILPRVTRTLDPARVFTIFVNP